MNKRNLQVIQYTDFSSCTRFQ